MTNEAKQAIIEVMNAMQEALKFYANPENYGWHNPSDDGRCAVMKDMGARARTALRRVVVAADDVSKKP